MVDCDLNIGPPLFLVGTVSALNRAVRREARDEVIDLEYASTVLSRTGLAVKQGVARWIETLDQEK